MRFSAAVLILWGGAAFVDVHAFAPSTERAFVVASQRRTPPRAAVAFTAPTSSSSTQLNLFASVRPTTAVSSCGEHDPLNNRHSASDWLYNVRSFPQSKVLREIRNPVLTVAAWSFFVSVLHRVCKTSFPALAANMSIPGTAHSFLVSALGLLLVFRTNSAYQRFNEGRKIWENILSVSRNMSRMIQLYSKEVGPEKQRRITNLVAAYPYLLRQHIRPGCLCSTDANIPAEHRLLLHEQRYLLHETRHEGQDDNRKGNAQLHELEPLTTECWVDKRALPWSLFLPQSLPAIAHAENRPLWVCDRMAALIAKIPYGPNFTSRERLVLLGMVDKLTNAVGQCERIHQTAVPLNYARHSLRSLTLWLFTLPFALVNDLGLFTAPANAAIAWLFFGVYQIGYSIEDPFQGSLRLSILCDAIRRSVIRQAFEMRDSAYQLDDCDERYEECSTAANEQHDSMSVPELKDAIRRSVMENVATVVAERDDGEIVQLLFDQQESLVPTTKQPSLHGKEVHQQEHLLTPDDNNTCVQPQLPEPILTDEALLKAPKLVRCMNGTWVEVGI